MNKLLFCLLFAPILSVAQKVPNHANVIYVSGVTKVQFKDSLVRAGFTVVDHDSTSFVTLPRQYKILEHGNLVIEVKAVDSALRISGIYNLVAGDMLLAPYGNKWKRAEQTWAYSIQKEAFAILVVHAGKMPGKVSYAKEKLPSIEVRN